MEEEGRSIWGFPILDCVLHAQCLARDDYFNLLYWDNFLTMVKFLAKKGDVKREGRGGTLAWKLVMYWTSTVSSCCVHGVDRHSNVLPKCGPYLVPCFNLRSMQSFLIEKGSTPFSVFYWPSWHYDICTCILQLIALSSEQPPLHNLSSGVCRGSSVPDSLNTECGWHYNLRSLVSQELAIIVIANNISISTFGLLDYWKNLGPVQKILDHLNFVNSLFPSFLWSFHTNLLVW